MRWPIEVLGAGLLVGAACAWFAAFTAFGRRDDAVALYFVGLGLVALWAAERLSDFSARGTRR